MTILAVVSSKVITVIVQLNEVIYRLTLRKSNVFLSINKRFSASAEEKKKQNFVNTSIHGLKYIILPPIHL